MILRAAQVFVLRWSAAFAHRIRMRFTAAGQGFLCAAIVAAAFGIDVTRTRALQVAALCAGFLLVGALFLVQRPPRISVSRNLPRYGTVGIPLSYTVSITNDSPRRQLDEFDIVDELDTSMPTFADFRSFNEAPDIDGRIDRFFGFKRWLRLIRYRRGGAIGACRSESLPPRSSNSLTVTLLPLRRGLLHFTSTTLRVADPLGLVHATRRLVLPDSIVILPRRYHVPMPDTGLARRHQAGHGRRAGSVGDSLEFLALREYVMGDAMRHIHWRSWGRTGIPIVKQFENEYLSRLALLVDTSTIAGPALETALSIAASYVTAEHAQDSIIDLLLMGSRLIESSAGRGLGTSSSQLILLACAKPTPANEFRRFSQSVLAILPRMSAAILILPAWNEERRAFVRALQQRGLPALFFITAAAPPSDAQPGVRDILHVRPDHIEEDLARHRNATVSFPERRVSRS